MYKPVRKSYKVNYTKSKNCEGAELESVLESVTGTLDIWTSIVRKRIGRREQKEQTWQSPKIDLRPLECARKL